MLIKTCRGCKYYVWMVGIGLGVRCTKEENQKYKDGHLKNLPVIISLVPNDTKCFDNIKCKEG